MCTTYLRIYNLYCTYNYESLLQEKTLLYHISHICIQMQSITAVLTDCIAKFNTYDTTKHNHDYNMNVQQQKTRLTN